MTVFELTILAIVGGFAAIGGFVHILEVRKVRGFENEASRLRLHYYPLYPTHLSPSPGLRWVIGSPDSTVNVSLAGSRAVVAGLFERREVVTAEIFGPRENPYNFRVFATRIGKNGRPPFRVTARLGGAIRHTTLGEAFDKAYLIDGLSDTEFATLYPDLVQFLSEHVRWNTCLTGEWLISWVLLFYDNRLLEPYLTRFCQLADAAEGR